MSEQETPKVELQPGQISYEQLGYVLSLLREGFAAYDMSTNDGIEVVGDWHEREQLVLGPTTTPTLKRVIDAAVKKASKDFLKKVDAEVHNIIPDMPALHGGTVRSVAYNIDLSMLRQSVRRQP